MKKKIGTGYVIFSALCVSLLVCALFGLGGMRAADGAVEDALYQQPRALDGSILVIGIDSASLDQVGAWPWDRAVHARVIERLNENPASRPAAIGLDIICAGTTNPDSDRALAKAAAAGNVVVACSAEYSSRLVRSEDGAGYMEDFYVSNVLYPYEELRQNALVGHTNAMYDSDGVLRHHLWSVRAGAREILSLPYQLYRLYHDYWGIDGDFDPPRSNRGFWYMDFAGRPGAFYAYSVADILNGDYDPQVLEGAVVLIGPYDMGLSDDFVTAADHAQRMYGVEYLANVLSAMERGAAKVEVARLPQVAALFLLCVLFTLLFFRLRPVWGALLYVVLAVGAVLLCMGFYSAGWLLHPLWLPAGLLAGYLVSVAGHYYSAQREKIYIRSTFQRYVDPSILQELLREGAGSLELKGKTVDIAVLFVDLRGFTPLSEALAPEWVVELLNEYLSLTSRCIRNHGGTLDKFVGDCTMAFWGAPLSCPDPVYRACRAAMDMAEGAVVLANKLRERYGVEISFGVGVHYGPAVVGNIGSTERMDYTAIGDTVNTASRLESAAPAGKIYISRAVADALGAYGETTSLGGSVRLKGKAEGFEVLTLDAVHETAEEVGAARCAGIK